MDRPTLLVLVRHGESDRNVAKKGNVYFADEESRKSVRGVADHRIGLTARGRRQAEITGHALRDRYGAFDALYHSGYRRTVETAEGILAAYPDDARARIDVRPNLFLRERDAGYAYDMTTAEAEAAFPWLHEYWRTSGSFFARPPGGESVAQLCERLHLFLDTVFRERAGMKVLAVGHGVAMRGLRFLLEHWTIEEMEQRYHADPPGNASVTAYRYDATKGRLVLVEANTLYWTDADL